MTAVPMFPKPTRFPKARKGLKRTASLARTAMPRRKRWMVRRRPRRLDDPRQSDPARLTWVHFEICEVRRIEYDAGRFRVMTRGQADCRGKIEAAHEGERKPGVALKSPDGSCFALCRKHHRPEWTEHKGAFEGWSKERRREWADARGAATQARYLSAGSRRSLR